MSWAKIMYSDFINHFSALNDKQIVKDIRKSIEDLAEGNSRGKSFGAFIVKSTKERIAKVSKINTEKGRKGGLALAAKYRKIKELANRNLNSGKPNHDKTNDPTLTVPTAGGSCGEISDAATTSRASTVSTNPSQEAPTRKAGDELIESGNGSLRNPPPSCEEHLDKALQSQRTGAAPDRVKNQPSSHCGKAPVRSFGESGLVHMTDAQANSLRSYYGEDFDRAVGILENYILSLPSKAEGDENGEAKFWREDYAKRNHYFAMRRDNWVDNALKKAKTADKRLENASNPNYKSFKQQDIDARTEFFSKSIFDGKEAI